jgi:thioredoxin reductase
MADVIVVGDGPGGLSAALFLAKNGKSVTVFGQDKTAMHAALLLNYLGVEEMAGTDFQTVARRQVARVGAAVREERVESIAADGDSYVVTTAAGEKVRARYLVLSEGKGPRLARDLGVDFE